jgi:hypothetical protein
MKKDSLSSMSPSFMFMYCTRSLLLQEPNINEMDIQFFYIPLAYSIAKTFFYFLIENQLPSVNEWWRCQLRL